MTVQGRVLRGAAACAPALVTLAIVGHFWSAGPRDFVPTWNDEIVYWTEIAAFATTGFDSGYFTIHEQPAPLAFSPYGAHGPVFPVVMGTLASVTGWRLYTPFIFNLLIVTVAAAIWVFSTGGRVGRGTAALFLATFWPIAFYLPSNMQEPVHFAIAFVAASQFSGLHRSPSARVLAASVALIVFASMLRPTWALFSIPLLWILLPRARWMSIPLGLVITAAAYAAFNRIAAPFPNAVNTLVAQAPGAPLAALQTVVLRAADNVLRFFSPANATLAEVLLRYEVAAALAVMTAIALRRRDPRDAVVAALLIAGPAVMVVIAVGWVESYRDFRAISPAFLAALLVAGTASPAWLRSVGAANLVLGLAVVPTFLELHESRFRTERASIRQLAQAIAPHVAFRRDLPRWDNTVLMHVELLQYPVLGLPPGIGVSFVLDWRDQPLPPRSRFLLLRDEEARQIGDRVTLTRLADTSLGTLYRNEVTDAATTGGGSAP